MCVYVISRSAISGLIGTSAQLEFTRDGREIEIPIIVGVPEDVYTTYRIASYSCHVSILSSEPSGSVVGNDYSCYVIMCMSMEEFCLVGF